MCADKVRLTRVESWCVHAERYKRPEGVQITVSTVTDVKTTVQSPFRDNNSIVTL